MLGKRHVNDHLLDFKLLNLLDDYHANFNLQSKPAIHFTALSKLEDGELLKELPNVLTRLI